MDDAVQMTWRHNDRILVTKENAIQYRYKCLQQPINDSPQVQCTKEGNSTSRHIKNRESLTVIFICFERIRGDINASTESQRLVSILYILYTYQKFSSQSWRCALQYLPLWTISVQRGERHNNLFLTPSGWARAASGQRSDMMTA